jgi:hypothetical protein
LSKRDIDRIQAVICSNTTAVYRPPAQDHAGLITLAQIASAMEGETYRFEFIGV